MMAIWLGFAVFFLLLAYRYAEASIFDKAALCLFFVLLCIIVATCGATL